MATQIKLKPSVLLDFYIKFRRAEKHNSLMDSIDSALVIVTNIACSGKKAFQHQHEPRVLKAHLRRELQVLENRFFLSFSTNGVK